MSNEEIKLPNITQEDEIIRDLKERHNFFTGTQMCMDCIKEAIKLTKVRTTKLQWYKAVEKRARKEERERIDRLAYEELLKGSNLQDFLNILRSEKLKEVEK